MSSFAGELFLSLGFLLPYSLFSPFFPIERSHLKGFSVKEQWSWVESHSTAAVSTSGACGQSKTVAVQKTLPMYPSVMVIGSILLSNSVFLKAASVSGHSE